MQDIKPSAYNRLTPEGRRFVDAWLETGSKREVNTLMEWNQKTFSRVNRYLENPLVQEAIEERQTALQHLPDRIMKANEVLMHLTDLAREGSNEKIRLGALIQLDKRYSPQKHQHEVTFDMKKAKSLFSDVELEELGLVEETVKVHR